MYFFDLSYEKKSIFFDFSLFSFPYARELSEKAYCEHRHERAARTRIENGGKNVRQSEKSKKCARKKIIKPPIM